MSFDEAQILVHADLTIELPTEYFITGEEEGELDAIIKFSYPWLPPICSCCGKCGHQRESCLVFAVAEAEKLSTIGKISDDVSAVPAPKENVPNERLSFPSTASVPEASPSSAVPEARLSF